MNGLDFQKEGFWKKLEEVIATVHSLNPSLLTLHFPTDNADYFNQTDIHDNLLRFVDLAHKYNIPGITIHANQFISVEEYKTYPLAEVRKRMLDYYGRLDETLSGGHVWIGVENLPIIGNQGIDFDPIFIYPEDYTEFVQQQYRNIFVTWDLCHWGISYQTHRSISTLLHTENPHDRYDKFLELPNLKHFHFSLFSQLAMPYSRVLCQEGVLPDDGDLDPNLYIDCLRRIAAAYPENTGIVFEVKEENYAVRKQAWLMKEWFLKNIMREVTHAD